MYKEFKLSVILWGTWLIQGVMLIVFAKCSRGYIYSRGVYFGLQVAFEFFQMEQR
jgi:hypothetical protein